MLEAKLEEQIFQTVESLGGMAIKLYSPGVRGRSDRLIILPGGRMFFIEIKRPGGRGRVSPHQVKFINDVRKLGVPAYVIDTFDAFACLIEKIRRPA